MFSLFFISLTFIFFFLTLFIFLKRKSFSLRIFSGLEKRLLCLSFPIQIEKEGEKEIKEELEKVSQFLGVLSEKKEDFVFEIAVPCFEKNIRFYLACQQGEVEWLTKLAESFWPEIQVKTCPDYNIFHPEGQSAGAYLTLKKSWPLPIKFASDFQKDPLEIVVGTFDKLAKEGEGMAFQLIVKGQERKNNQLKKVISCLKEGKSLSDSLGRKNLLISFFDLLLEIITTFFSPSTEKQERGVTEKKIDEKLIEDLEKKASYPFLSVNLRLLSSASTKERAESLLSQISSSFSQFDFPGRNSFQIKRPKNLNDFIIDFSWRNFSPKIAFPLSSLELAGLWHPPFAYFSTSQIKKEKVKELPPPEDLSEEGIILGKNTYHNQETIIRLAKEDRRRHLYIIGQTGTGKSAFLQNLTFQDIINGEGACLIDPHGDLIEELLGLIPEERKEDVILFEPGNPEVAFGLNMLEYDPEKPEQKSFIANEMIEIFYQLYSQETMGPMFEQYMRNSLLLLMDRPENKFTLIEVPRVLTDEEFRHSLLEKCQNSLVYNFWLKEAEKAGGEAALENIAPYITSKLNSFISNDYLRPILGQSESSVDFRKIMDEKKIFLVNLAKGKIGELNARLLGMIIVGKIFMAALSRVDLAESQRKDFYLYLDEFQNLTTRTIASILSEARKYRLNLIIAHQFIAQLKDEIKEAVFGNVGTMVIFRVGSQDAEFLIKEFEPLLKISDLTQLENFFAYVKLITKGKPSLPFNMKTFPPEKGLVERGKEIKKKSLSLYGKDRQVIEKEIEKRLKLI